MGVLTMICILSLCWIEGEGVAVLKTSRNSYITAASQLCKTEMRDLDCTHQFRKSAPNGSCKLHYIKRKDCSATENGRRFAIQDFPFSLTVYRYSSWMTTRTSFNLTFPNPDWLYVDFQYRRQKAYITKSNRKDICRRFEVTSKAVVSLETLFWDCLLFNDINYQNDIYDLLIKDSNGYGGKYIFRIPDVNRIGNNTRLENWEVFQFLHWSYIYQTHWIPVTFQFAPFNDLKYNVTLVKCHDDIQGNCTKSQPLQHKLVTGPPKMDTSEGQGRFETVVFDRRHQAAKYAVTIEIIENCPHHCFVSVSPVFEIIHIKEQQKVSVLLVYSANLSIYFELIKELAAYLQERCCVQPFYVDKDVTGQDPSFWTAEKIVTSDKVLFFVFDTTRGDGVTPIKEQWNYALTYFSGPYIRKYFNSNKFAVITFPFYSHVPDQIGHLKRFQLMGDFYSLVTWIHNGTILDNYMIWKPILTIPGPIKNGRERLKSIIKATQKEMEALSSAPISDSSPLIAPTIQKCHCQNGKCCHGTGVSSCDSVDKSKPFNTISEVENPVDMGELFDTSSEIENKASRENAFDASIPRPSTLPIFGEEPHVQCTMKNTNMDSSLVNAFFGL
ncbi:uncharacterized protein LOC143038010 isoform X2 [Oratosquilla oratoria]|uniref:uncharacterized protein LOC143038010 isoform X2 n=1 Tax=Oratosquilla oratoria TaxID=337810 RepID=UPI003F76773F